MGNIRLCRLSVLFDSDKHEYFYAGQRLPGVTGRIGAHLGMRFPKGLMVELQQDGLHVHKAIERYINRGDWDSIHPSALWVKDYLDTNCDISKLSSEVLVSDHLRYSSSVDIVEETEQGLNFYDIKRTFNRVYVTWQLSIYKYFAERYLAGLAVGNAYRNMKVRNLYCIAVRDQMVYPILPFPALEVEKVLYGEVLDGKQESKSKPKQAGTTKSRGKGVEAANKKSTKKP